MAGRPVLVFLAAVLVSALATGCGQRAVNSSDPQNWRASMREVRMSIRGAEDDPAMIRQWDAYQNYLSGALGLPVKFFEASDYNGTIQALASGQVDVAQMGGGAYANVYGQVGDKAAPILVSRQAEGNVGYYSALMVKTDSPYHKIEDLRGKSLGYVDFNSTSGYLYPRMMMRRLGIDPETYFGKTAFAGGHTQAVMGLDRGQFDAALVMVSGGTPETGFTTGAHFSMAQRGLVNLKDFRIIWSVGEIPNSPIVVRTDRAQAFVDLLRGAYAMIPYDHPDVLAKMGLADGSDYAAVDHETYKDIIALRQEDIDQRRGGRTPPAASPQTPAGGGRP